MKQQRKRVTIYDLAQALGISASYVSRALNNHPSISTTIQQRVKDMAQQLNYRPNSQAANLRKGSSRTIGVVVPKINEQFFANAIAGIEAVCAANQHTLIICQSEESLEKEQRAIENLIHLNVDAILISISGETFAGEHLQEVLRHHIELIQFDRALRSVATSTILNNNHNAAFQAVQHLLHQGYTRIAYLGGPPQLDIYRHRKAGYRAAMRQAGLALPAGFVVDHTLSTEKGFTAALSLLQLAEPPDAFFAATDYAALGVLQAAAFCGKQVPQQLGVVGFENEIFAGLLSPGLSSIEQHARQMGMAAANVYFHQLHAATQQQAAIVALQVDCELIIRASSSRR